MVLQRWCALVALFSLHVLRVVAEQTVTVDGADPQIKYVTTDSTNTYPTWVTINRSQDTCDTPQQLTERTGDYAQFSFTGTSVTVIGTVGVKRGIIGISLDGTNTTFDRTANQKVCDATIFQKNGLTLQQHTLILSLEQKQTSLVNGQEVGILSIQRIRYTIPGGSSGSSNIGAIVGGAIGAVVLIAAIAVGVFFLRRRRQKVNRRSDHTFFDADDIPPSSRPTPGQMVAEANSGFVASPFSWSGPGSQYPQQQPQYPEQPQYAQYPNAPTNSYYGGDSNPSSPTPQQPLLHAAESGPSYPVNLAHRDSHSQSTSSRERKMRESGQQQYYLNNPDRTSYTGSYIGHGGGGGVDDETLVDRIAHRLADIMGARVGMPVNIADMVPPPVYEGRAEDEVADFQRRIEKRMEDIQQERRDAQITVPGPSTTSPPSHRESFGPTSTELPYPMSTTLSGTASQVSSPPTSAPAQQQAFINHPMSPPPVFEAHDPHPQYAYGYQQQAHGPSSPPPALPPGAAPSRASSGTLSGHRPPSSQVASLGGNGKIRGPRSPNNGNKF
ncbi:hypothetical protein FRC03_003821 [Tulasnella sp. 419]|nr:hypothetical protein FRC03_003821 [Tulasnella sp. 419]